MGAQLGASGRCGGRGSTPFTHPNTARTVDAIRRLERADAPTVRGAGGALHDACVAQLFAQLEGFVGLWKRCEWARAQALEAVQLGSALGPCGLWNREQRAALERAMSTFRARGAV